MQRFWLHRRDRYHAVTQTYNFGAETHLCSGDTTAFVVPLAAIARALSLTFVASTALTKGPQRFWPHGCDRCRSLTLTADTPHAGEVVNAVIISCLPFGYTVVIAIMQCRPKRTILVLKLTLVVEIQALLSCRQPPLHVQALSLTFVEYSSHERPAKILTTLSWSLSFTDA